MSCGFIMQNYTNHSELLIGQFYFVENKAASSETALFIFEGDLSYPFTHSLSAPTIAEATAITILRILSQIDFFIFFD